MPGLSLAEVAHATGGQLRGRGEARIRGVVVDSRKARPGDLFVALGGARTDGHRYLRSVQQAGAVGALVMPDRGDRPDGLPTVVVPDTLTALAALARFHLGRTQARLVGITGSVGKTTAKDFLHHFLGAEAAGVHAAPASYNSECGLPLAVLAAPVNCRWMVLEYGINAPGEMERLLRVARPHHVLITALTEVHLEGMGSLDTIVEEKLRLAAAVRSGGQVFVDSHVRQLAGQRPKQWAARLVEHGLHQDECTLLDAQPGAMRLEHAACGTLTLPVVAPHEAELALRCALAAHALGVDASLLRQRAASLRRPVGRLEIHRWGGVTVVDDSYNSSPAAVERALEVLRDWPGARRRLAVLGTMHELGAGAEQWHRRVGEGAAAAGLDALFGVGSGGAWIAEAAQENGLPAWVADDVEAIATQLAPRLQDGDVVLLKASRGVRLEGLLEPLRRHLSATPDPAEDRR